MTHARLERCPCCRYRFALRYVAVAVATAYGVSVRVTECPARGFHVQGGPGRARLRWVGGSPSADR